MEFEKTTVIAAPAARVWQMLLDPQLMRDCVPGMESIEVLSDTQYIANLQVKVSFVSARFKVRTTIVEMRPPQYLRSEGVGEDSSLTSSLKQSSEVFLTDRGDSTMELRMRFKIEIFGRLGSFGLDIIKTKADRMWQEFGRNFTARVQV